VIADFGPYLDAQAAVDADWANQQEWRRRSMLTLARSGFFSSDRAIRQYAAEIWNVAACPVDMCCPLHP
jgi:starch phosphorylase